MPATTAEEDRFRRFVLNHKDIGFDRMMEIIRQERDKGKKPEPIPSLDYLLNGGVESAKLANPYHVGYEIYKAIERIERTGHYLYPSKETATIAGCDQGDPPVEDGKVVVDLTGIGVHYVGPLPNYKAGQYVMLKNFGQNPYRVLKRFIRDGQYWYRVEGRRFPADDPRRDRMTDEVTEDKIAGIYDFAHQPVNL